MSTLRGVGARIAERLQVLGIETIQDALFHLPRRYLDRTQVRPIGGLVAGEDALVQGSIELAQVQFGRRRSLLCRISDGTGSLTLRFFHFSRAQQNNLERGRFIQCWGQVRRVGNKNEMIHPEYQLISEYELGKVEDTLTPVYPATEGLSQSRFRSITTQAMDALENDSTDLVELLPTGLLSELNLPGLGEALSYVHRPPVDADVEALIAGTHPAQQRLAFEELVAQHLSLRSLRKKVQALPAPRVENAEKTVSAFIGNLPFSLTRAQQRVLEEIRSDISTDTPMLRLVQGDVGSGKTVVAAIAALQVITSGFQVCFMAPTELLAEQHFHNLSKWFEATGIPIALLTGKMSRAERNPVLQRMASAEPCFLVGTHALFQDEVSFGNLGLVIVDEQHRFGVHQRLALIQKAATGAPHQLIMTATPIPRTLAMTIFADLDISVIDELPPGRKAVNTIAISNTRRDDIVQRIRVACDEGRQVYWVCTLIDESDSLQAEAATDTCQLLQEQLPQHRVGLVHGRMKSSDKTRVMTDFKNADIDLLVATTVIEVGVDVPNASLMIIENSERLGLSQLHQLRGRVGRGEKQSDCVLMYQAPLSDFAQARLEIMRQTNDGFEIAREDLELRGPGDLLGTRQTGLPALRIADIVRDAELVPMVQKSADLLLQHHEENVNLLIKRWIAERVVFGKV